MKPTHILGASNAMRKVAMPKPTPLKPIVCRPVPWWVRLFNFWRSL